MSRIIDLEERGSAKACEMWLWRKALNISSCDKVCNEEVLRRVGKERAIISVINRKQRVRVGDTYGMVILFH